MSGLIVGVDEAGRGPLVGNVVAAAVMLPFDFQVDQIPGLTDSKKLSEKKREALFPLIQQQAVCWAIAEATPAEIDELNILHATMLAMKRAVGKLDCGQYSIEKVLIDGNRVPPDLPFPAEAVVKGDSKIAAISAASILAKVTRDQQMVELHQQYPEYGFDRHKGYPTKAHFEALQKSGALPEHRRSFKPVQRVLR